MTYPHDIPVVEPESPEPVVSSNGPRVGQWARIARPLWPASPYLNAVGEIMEVSGHHEESKTKERGPMIWLRMSSGDQIPRWLCELKLVIDPKVIEANRVRYVPWNNYWDELIAHQRRVRPPRPTKNKDKQEN